MVTANKSAILQRVKVVPAQDDSPDFVAAVDAVTNGIVSHYTPQSLVLIKIDNWFGPKWLRFSGKTLGAVGVWNKQNTPKATLPPFVPNRVVLQRRFAAPDYREVESGKSIHRSVPSNTALLRSVAEAVPNAAVVWYSGKSQETGRGAVMAYVPSNGYVQWYGGWQKARSWGVVKACGISLAELSRLVDLGLQIRR